MSRNRTAIVGVAAATALLAGCSSSTSGRPQPAPQPPRAKTSATPRAVVTSSTSSTPALSVPDACSLLTQVQAEALAGVKLRKGDDSPAQNSADTATCSYDSPPTGSSGSVQIFTQLSTPRALNIDKAIHHKFRTVPGIGDQTLEEPQNSSIFVRKGQVWVYLSVPYGATPRLLERAAAQVAARLP